MGQIQSTSEEEWKTHFSLKSEYEISVATC